VGGRESRYSDELTGKEVADSSPHGADVLRISSVGCRMMDCNLL